MSFISLFCRFNNREYDGLTIAMVRASESRLWGSYVRDEDKLLIYPDMQQVKYSLTGYDLLYRLMIPGVDVDRMGGKVTSLGKEASPYIDGQPVGFREAQSLQPRDVEKVEYHDMPERKYADDFVAINFITKKKYTAGGYVSLDGSIGNSYPRIERLNSAV